MAAPTTESESEPAADAGELGATVADPAPVEDGLPGDDEQPRALWERAAGWAVVAICTWMVFCIVDANHAWTLNPAHFRFGDLFRNTTANGGDMGAHVWWPKFLIDNWFPKFRLSGWAPDWYAGFPAGQYYFPVPALMIGALQLVMPYNVAFKLVTVSGPLLLPAAAYSFAKGLKAPWPAPPAFAIAAFGTLVQTRNDWQIYGGNIASTLAGEFSFTIGLAFALFGLGALAYTLDTGRRRWLPAVLIALAIMSHIVVAIFIALASVLLWLSRRPWRTWRIAVPVGVVAGALSAVWLLPLVAQQSFTQSMRYEKDFPRGTFKLPSWMPLPGPIRFTLNGLWNALQRPPLDTNANPVRHFSPTLWLPNWMWFLAAVAIIAAGWYRRRSTLVLLIMALVVGVLFIEWPQDFAIWNTRFLPFWMLSWALVAAMGATELARLAALGARRVYAWIRDGDLQDARAHAWAAIATADEADSDADARKEAAWVLAERRFERGPEGWAPPDNLSKRAIDRAGLRYGALALVAVIVFVGGFAMIRGFDAAGNSPSIAIRGWASWNYAGYEAKSAYPQFKAVMTAMEQVADEHGPGRALWEPASGEPDALNNYGTPLALMLLPYFTHGKIDSMEGIYFESSATTDYHFLTVSECAPHPSNPVRGLKYGSSSTDFDMCVRHLQMLGVRYYMAWTPREQEFASRHPDLTLVKDIPQTPALSAPEPEKQLKDWKVYEVAKSDLVVGLAKEPVVLTSLRNGTESQCFADPSLKSQHEPRLQDGWECATAPWWMDPDRLGTAYAQSGPKDWTRVKAADLAKAQPRAVDPVGVANVRTTVDTISFDVSDVGRPVEVKESYFPNWKVSGAKGPYRLAPNLMVVVPTSKHVELSYGLTKADWAGRAITAGGAVGLVLLALWTGARRFAGGDEPAARPDDGDGEGGATPPPAGRDGDDDIDGHDTEADERGPFGEEPPGRADPEPASLP